ncbi:PAS domain S-box protein [Bacteroidota bacterium]
MKRYSITLYILSGFAAGFLFTFIGITFEDIIHNIPFRYSVSQYQHYILPVITGLVTSIISYYWFIRRQQRITALSELRESEKRYRSLFDNMNDAVCIIDADHRIIDANQEACDLHEYPLEELKGMSISELVYEPDKETSDEYFDQLDRNGSYKFYEGRIKSKSGTIKWIQVNSTAIINDGKVIGAQDIIRDITERKENEILLKKTVERLDELNKMKDTLFTIISHDLRSPFNSILGLSELVVLHPEKYDVEKLQERMETINTTAKNVYHLLENLLSWAKTQIGSISFAPKKVVLNEIVDKTLQFVKEDAVRKNIQIKKNYNPKIELLGDENMLSLVLRNLISNAIKFTHPQGIIDLTARKEHSRVIIKVSDPGLGMNKEKLQTIFTTSINSSMGTNKEKGSGIGLMLCKEFVELQGGVIQVESEEGKGSTFTITLPQER